MGFLVSILVFAVICSVPAHFSEVRENIFVLQDPNSEDNRTVVVVTWTDDEGQRCEIFSDEQLTERVRKISKDQLLRKPSREEMGNLLEECTMFSFNGNRQDAPERITTTPRTTTEDNSGGWNVIFPGTKWCGAGNIAKDDDDLGFLQDTDRCCRAHDNCDDIIEGGGTKYNLTNKSPFTKLICKCDDDFHDCLSRVNTVTSNTIGNTYFNVLRRTCYELGYPKSKKCKKHRT
ncbi:phospholipase A2 [Caerostris darwini]|uniref:Phospholipase A2 n=1 Tax=Caerostris darwini TaxID=1538125 RepID=A0AAV4RS55_9ARAC|nr:phospholipase A2 [Caerostris darwini]